MFEAVWSKVEFVTRLKRQLTRPSLVSSDSEELVENMLHIPLETSDALPDCWVGVQNQDWSHDTVVEVTDKADHPSLGGQNQRFFLSILKTG